ncbi:MAG: ThuA domain-containing protein [Bacteroidetes bacterium]|nr:ThuA domain-containing protein [Bacteroidota bacterium]MDA1120948.1 ThuA domain-containing protein [Bacteroidota bacterium]
MTELIPNVKRTILLALIPFLFYNVAKSQTDQMSVLVFSKTSGYRHESIETGIATVTKMGTKYDFDVDATEDASMFKRDILSKYDVVIFMCTTKDVLDDTQQNEFIAYIQSGGAFVGVHAAADTEYEWPWYNKLVGAWFKSHPKTQEAVVQRINPTHVSTKMLPDRWTRTDEWYNYKNIATDINVLLKLDESSYEGGDNNGDHPIAWYHEFDGGRAWYTGLGHTKESYSDPLFVDHLWGGIQYAAGLAN